MKIGNLIKHKTITIIEPDFLQPKDIFGIVVAEKKVSISQGKKVKVLWCDSGDTSEWFYPTNIKLAEEK